MYHQFRVIPDKLEQDAGRLNRRMRNKSLTAPHRQARIIAA